MTTNCVYCEKGWRHTNPLMGEGCFCWLAMRRACNQMLKAMLLDESPFWAMPLFLDDR